MDSFVLKSINHDHFSALEQIVADYLPRDPVTRVFSSFCYSKHIIFVICVYVYGYNW